MTLELASPLGVMLLLGIGVFAGFANTLAGGGSFLTLPLLMLFGLPADVANGTNRISVVAQSFAGALAFDAAGKLDRRAVVRVVTPTLFGALLGAFAASSIPADTLQPILIGTLLVMAVTLVYTPQALSPGESTTPAVRSPTRPRDLGGLFLIGVYGGFLQAGVGLFLLAYLGGVLRYDLVRGNALKGVAVAVFSLVALAVFVTRGQVSWVIGGVLAAGTVVGARLGVRFALVRGARAIRYVLFAATLLCCVAVLADTR